MREIIETTLKRERLNPTCLMCVLNKNIHHYPEHISTGEKVDYMQKVYSLLANADKRTAIPVLSRDIEQLRYEMFGIKDDYASVKWHFNEMLLDQIDSFRTMISKAKDPLKLALKLSLVGNYIDFAALDHIDEEYLEEMLKEAEKKEIDEETIDHWKKDMEKGGRMVFFTDNCGEIVLDRLLIELLKEMYPSLTVAVIVKGGETVNDATMEDAVQVGLDRIVPVIGNGSNVAGTWFPEMTEESLDLVEQADILFAKGQANFETLRHCGRNAYYLFLCKCRMFADQFRVPPLTGIFMHEDDPKNR